LIPSLSLSAITHEKLQAFCKEAVMWKRLNHPNIVPLLGVNISSQLQLVSDWMSGGELPKYIKEHSDADLLGLVGVSLVAITPR
jgi:serine/threonine protein kinase